ncbi:MAG: RdgB/HAM1 family non-canonical purine NTP pyrophosphatase [Chloroflexota bacterium]|nr:RdgB/HAM1 family non-canonical purine NTP pyrophosphatase [Chloroflexota bacterium]
MAWPLPRRYDGRVTQPRLVLATNNDGKLREFRELLDGCGCELVTPAQLGVPFNPDETGASFEENATIKAVEATRSCGLRALADDSGLEIDYLGGRPGIFSARYAGGDRTDPSLTEQQQVRIVLDELQGVPDDQRTARFRCVIAIAATDGGVQTADGVFEGRIAHEPRGEHGFGYDPIFFVPELGMTSAELPPEEKNKISHRAQAALKARELLRMMSGDYPTA